MPRPHDLPAGIGAVIAHHPPQPAPRLYGDLAWLWPLLSPPEHYLGEADIVRRVIDESLGPAAVGRRSILELGAGGGHTLVHLADEFDTVAVDLSEPMLAGCRRLSPTTQTIVGDMRSLRVNRAFDAVLIHDAIDYMTTETDVRAALATARAHLVPGGVALIAPTYLRETFRDHELETDQHITADIALSYVSYIYTRAPATPATPATTFELLLVYLIKQPADAVHVRIEHDRHTCGLFGRDDWLNWLSDAGFNATHHEEEAWSLFTAVAR
ncbi:MAG: class I SAM-dependent methyltransferase [Phycisphaeraceae bacterium]